MKGLLSGGVGTTGCRFAWWLVAIGHYVWLVGSRAFWLDGLMKVLACRNAVWSNAICVWKCRDGRQVY